MRPRIICHMMTSVDGKITGSYMDSGVANVVGLEYEHINNEYKAQAWLCGRITTDENFTFYNKPDLDENAAVVEEGDFVAVNNAHMYYVSVDPSGKIGWTSNILKYEKRPDAHVVEILTEKASNSYKSFLRRLNISYIIAGNETLDCKLASEKLYKLFGIKTLLVAGGGYINASFLSEGLIDELSLLIAPVTDCDSNTSTLFERGNYQLNKTLVTFDLLSVEKVNGDGIWLRYSAKK